MSPAVALATESETYCLGAALVDAKARNGLLGTLRPGDFYSEEARSLFAAIAAAPEEAETLSGAIDVRELSLDAHTKQFARELVASVPPHGTWKQHADKVKNAATMRTYTLSLEAALVRAEEGWDATASIGATMARLEEILSEGVATGPVSIADGIDRVMERALLARQHEGIIGIRTGFGIIDSRLGGLQGGRNYIVGARAGVGKSTFAGTVAMNVARQDKRVLVQSSEMSADDYRERLAYTQAGITDSERETRLTEASLERLLVAIEEVKTLDIVIDDNAGATPDHLRRNIVRTKPDLVIIDYLQRMRIGDKRDYGKEYEKVSALTAEVDPLKQLYNVPLLTVVQLSRGPEHTPDKRPTMSDLRGSGHLEQDANVILLLHRPGKYDAEADPLQMDVHCPKNRHGAQDWLLKVWRVPGLAYLTDRR